MLETALNRLGDWNPQLFRELKGSFKPRNLIIAGLLSIVAQWLIWTFFQGLLPEAALQIDSTPMCGRYISGVSFYRCYDAVPDLGRVDWPLWWFDVGATLTLVMLVAAVVGGVYGLVGNVSEENRRGTLDFIRLSPQSGPSILLGKVLGVPALIYLAIVLAVPFQLFALFSAGLSAIDIVSLYALAVAGCGCFYVLSLLWAFVGNAQAQNWLAAILAIFWGWPCATVLYVLFQREPHMGFDEPIWYFVPLFKSMLFVRLFVLANLLAFACGIWQILERRYRDPNATLLSKGQSYVAVAYLEFAIVGFVWTYFSHPSPNGHFSVLYASAVAHLAIFVLLSSTFLVPTRQNLEDWARFRHRQRQRGDRRYSLLRDLIWGEKSPPLLALAINLAIVAAFWVPCLLRGLFVEGGNFSLAFTDALALFIAGVTIAIYAVIALWLSLVKPKHKVLARFAMSALVLPPFVLTAAFPVFQGTLGTFGLFLFGLPLLQSHVFSLLEFSLAIAAQLSLLAGLTWQFSRRLQKAGESELKGLLRPGEAIAKQSL